MSCARSVDLTPARPSNVGCEVKLIVMLTPVFSGSIPSSFSAARKARRPIWGVVYTLTFRPSPKVFRGWRRLVLRTMGATIGRAIVKAGEDLANGY